MKQTAYSSGVYKKKLYKIFFPTGFVVILLLGGLFAYFWSTQNKSDYLYYLSGSTSALESNSQVSMTLVSRGLNDAMRNPTLLDWTESSDKSAFYFSAVNAIAQLKTITTDSSLVNYDIATTTLYPKEFDDEEVHLVLTKSGSLSKEDFFLQHKGLNEKSTAQIFEHFKTSGRPIVLPHYVNNEFTSLYYITLNPRNQSQLLCFVTIPKEALVGSSISNDFLLYNSDGILAYSNNREDSISFLDQIYDTVKGKPTDLQPNYMKYNESYIFRTSIDSISWKIVYVYDNFVPETSQILLFCLIFILSFLALLYILYCLVERLYQPVREAITDSMLPFEYSKQPIDEFQVIRQKSEKIRTLSKSLQDVLNENTQLSSQKYYRHLLFSSTPMSIEGFLNPYPISGYCVALIEFRPNPIAYIENDVVIQKGYIQDFTLQYEHLIYIDVDHNRGALIIRSHDTIQTKQLLFTMLHYANQYLGKESMEPLISLSNNHEGIEQIHTCYKEAVNILEYKHLYTKSKILTYNQIALVDAVTYFYPLSMENKLVYSAIEGKKETLELFDQLIRINILEKTLSFETLQSLIYVLIGTISRIFQELKTPPENFIERNIDFKYWYDHWSDSVTISQMRITLEDVITTIHKKNDLTDKKLLNDMLTYIYTNYHDDIMLNDMADHFNISPKYCGILFKQLSDNNFKDFLNRYRIEKAKEILEKNPDFKISELSHMVGFNSSNSFIRVFGKYTGFTPKGYGEYIRKL